MSAKRPSQRSAARYWPQELDALTAAAGNHQLLLENDRVWVLLTTIPIGATTPVHTHRLPSVECVLAATNFVRRDSDGKVLLDTRTADAPSATFTMQLAITRLSMVGMTSQADAPPGDAADASRRTWLAAERTWLAWWRTGLAAAAAKRSRGRRLSGS